jgi:hypothetical protein|tara:strand:+ start:878 stop:1225 length:348 start_codon:yes stop_codon:yes gene_type:complete
MSGQIFKTNPPIDAFLFFFRQFGEFKNNKYILSKALFKKAKMKEKIQPYIDLIKPHYYNSKLFYIERKMTYKNFVTIIRQICKLYAIGFVSSIKYSKSTYEIKYSIFVPMKLINV